MIKKTVLVVDDQSGIRLLFKEILGQDGYEIVEAENGKVALDIIETKKPDLMILDYNLPIMNGKDLLQTLERKEINIPSILMSGLPERLEEEKDQFVMVRKVFGKPFNILDVRNEINSTLNMD